MSENYTYHGTFDTTYAPHVEHVPARDIFPEYFRVRLSEEAVLNLSRAQLVQLHDAIREGYKPAAAAKICRHSQVAEPFRSVLNCIHPSPESDLEERRRSA